MSSPFFIPVLESASYVFLGSVANDVETEQVLWDVSSSPNFRLGRFSSFVQRRGSVPLRYVYGFLLVVFRLYLLWNSVHLTVIKLFHHGIMLYGISVFRYFHSFL